MEKTKTEELNISKEYIESLFDGVKWMIINEKGFQVRLHNVLIAGLKSDLHDGMDIALIKCHPKDLEIPEGLTIEDFAKKHVIRNRVTILSFGISRETMTIMSAATELWYQIYG